MSGANKNSDDATTTAEPGGGVTVYGALLSAELRAQDARKASFEQRGVAVVTTSGALVTLLLGLEGFASKSAGFVLPAASHGWLIAGLVGFVLAAIAALLVNMPLSYKAVTADDIESRLKEDPIRTARRAERDVALTQVKALRDAKTKNGCKGRLLFVAVTLQVISVALLGVAVCIAISR